ncbi:MAG: alpha/beta hydrolase [Bacteroidota bacterium]
MIRYPFLSLSLVCASFLFSYGQLRTEAFQFSYDSLTYQGYLDYPQDQDPEAWIVLIPGSGQTDFGGTSGWNKWFMRLRTNFVDQGLGVCMWDRPGCGKSEGSFDPNQSVHSSAEEALAAIETIRSKALPGTDQIGLWGMSRGGWICPLIIQADSTVDFWITVSGVDSLENSNYLLETNLKLLGYSGQRAAQLVQEKRKGTQIFLQGGSYQEYLAATQNVRADSFYLAMFGVHWEEKAYVENQQAFLQSDEPSPLRDGVKDPIALPGFTHIIQSVRCPVLAIFGEKDSQVNWRDAQILYEATLMDRAPLEIVSFPDCNHTLMQCETGAVFENLEKFGYADCGGYHAAMNDWLGRIVRKKQPND